MKLTTLIFAIIIALTMTSFALAADCITNPDDPACAPMEMPECVGCDGIVPDGPGQLPVMTVEANSQIDLDQVLGEKFTLEPCDISGEAWAAQKAEGIIQLPTNVEEASGTIAVAAAQLNKAEDAGTVGGYAYEQTAQQYEKFAISVSADQGTPEAAFTADQNGTVVMVNEAYDNGLYSGASAASCFEASAYGINPVISGQAINQFAYSISKPEGDWQTASGMTTYSVNPPPAPAAPAAQ